MSEHRIVYKWFHDSVVKRLSSNSFCSGAVQNITRPARFPSFYVPESQLDTTLQFESRFEGANLLDATQCGDFEYNLRMRSDLYTSSKTQWFYFRVSGMRSGVSYKFNIVNFEKSKSQFTHGASIIVLIFSKILA